VHVIFILNHPKPAVHYSLH